MFPSSFAISASAAFLESFFREKEFQRIHKIQQVQSLEGLMLNTTIRTQINRITWNCSYCRSFNDNKENCRNCGAPKVS